MNRQRFAACCYVAILLCTLTPPNFVVAVSRIAGCSVPNLGKRVPVIFVHGFIGSPTMWGSKNDTSTMLGLVNELTSVYVDEPFDYHKVNTQWVDNPQIGPALALRIACLAQASRDAGGPGKVIVIAHSMGGLATRFAANVILPGGHKVSDDIGLVITIGTPNFGSLVADVGMKLMGVLCQVAGLTIPFAGVLLTASPDLCNSILPAMQAMQTDVKTKLGSLPMLPQSIPLMGIAGDVQSYFDAFESKITVSSSDTVVLANSALVGSSQQNQGAGTAVFHCQAVVPFFFWSDGNCSHGNLVTNAAVQLQVVKSIKLYLDSLQPGPTATRTPVVPVPTPTPTPQGARFKLIDQGLSIQDATNSPPPSPSDLQPGQDYNAALTIMNTGVTWSRQDTIGFRTANPPGRTSQFCFDQANPPSYPATELWVSCSQPRNVTSDCATGLSAGYPCNPVFIIHTPTQPGTYEEDFVVTFNGALMNGPIIHWQFTVK